MGYPARTKAPTETKLVTIAYVNERRDGQFSASVKDTDGDLYWVKEQELNLFQKGQRYEIEFTVTQSKNGFVNRTIETISQIPDEPPAVAQKIRQVTSQPQPSETPRVKHADPTPKRIYVCGGLNAAITSHQVNIHNIEDIVAVTENLMAAFDRTLGNE